MKKNLEAVMGNDGSSDELDDENLDDVSDEDQHDEALSLHLDEDDDSKSSLVGAGKSPQCSKKQELEEKKKFKRGIVYISYLPDGMRPTLLRNMLSKFAPVGRMFMQKIKEQKAEKRKRKGGPRMGTEKFSEGWVEFLKKRHAKQVAALLNNQPMGGKKKSKFHDCLWNLKYLSRFKWIHLVERLGYERAVLRQRMQNEISQAKRVASFFKDTVDREERQRRKAKAKAKSSNGEATDAPDAGSSSSYVFTQRETAEEKRAKRGDVGSGVSQEREKFLKSLFS